MIIANYRAGRVLELRIDFVGGLGGGGGCGRAWLDLWEKTAFLGGIAVKGAAVVEKLSPFQAKGIQKMH